MMTTHTDRYDRREIKRAPLALGNVSLAGVFEGYASLFGIADLGRDVVAPGAFADSLHRRGPNGVKLLWQHDAAEPIGSWLSIEEDPRGLKVRGRLNLAVARAREVLALMREGAVDGLSIGFRTRRATTDRATGLRTLQAIDLWEISVVTFPMHPAARVTAVKRATRHFSHVRGSTVADIRRELTQLRWRTDATALERWLRKMVRLEQRFSSDQPRDEQGRWTGRGLQSDQQFRRGLGIQTADAIDRENVCEEQYDMDSARCRGLQSSLQRQKCWASAMERYSSCLKGRPVTPLQF